MSHILTDHWLDVKKCSRCAGIMMKIKAGQYKCLCGYESDNY